MGQVAVQGFQGFQGFQGLGTSPAEPSRVGAKRVEELVVWQLASQLRKSLLAVTATVPFRRDFRLCSQVRASANSIEADIAEGFAHFRPKEFARFLRYARGSTHELLVHLTDAHDRHHISSTEHAEMTRLCRRLSIGLQRFIRYLERSEPPS
jgi:four helix bundle protein